MDTHHERTPERNPALLDSRCIERACEGSAAAREALVAHFTPVLRRFVKRRLGTRLRRFVGVEDLEQEIFVNALDALSRLRPGAGHEDFRKLLFQHANWVLLRQGGRAGRFTPQSHGVSGSAEGYDVRAPSLSTGEVTRADLRRWVDERIAQLDEKYAVVVRLYLDNKSFAEIGTSLEISEDAVRKRFLRASQKLRISELED